MISRRTRLLVPLLAALVGLAAGEVLLRTVFHVAPQVDLNIYRRDQAGNLRLQPNLDKRHVTPLWDVAVRTNADGWRDEPGEPATSVLGLGDSFAFGWGVDEEEGLYRLLEAEHDAKILNAAVPGTGTLDQAQLLETVCADARPRTVLLALFVGNDFDDVAGGGAGQFAVEDGLLVRNGSRDDSPSARAARLARRSRILQLLRALQFRYAPPGGEPRGWDEWMRRFAQIHLREGAGLLEPMAAALDRIHAWARARNARLAVIVIPRSWQLDPQELAAMTDALDIDPANLDLDQPQRFLARWGAERSVEVIDLLPAFRRAAAADPDLRLYHTPDAHWTAAGHALAARVAAEALQQP